MRRRIIKERAEYPAVIPLVNWPAPLPSGYRWETDKELQDRIDAAIAKAEGK